MSLEIILSTWTLYGDHKIWVRPEKMFFEEIERNDNRFRRFVEVPEIEVKSLGLI